MGIERIVRPYQLPQNTFATPVPPASGQSAAPVELKIGGSGQGKSYTSNFSRSISWYCTQAQSEFVNPDIGSSGGGIGAPGITVGGGSSGGAGAGTSGA
jgi:hypothetical protein